MRLIISFTIFSVVTEICWTETERESRGEAAPNDALKLVKDVKDQESNDMSNTLLNVMWANKPISQMPQVGLIDMPPRVLRQPHSVTKLAKSLTDSDDPYFRKDNFEPFERRPKPITLVAFRKRGIFSQQPMKFADAISSEIAELQSPYNEISSFWANSPYD